MEATGIYWVPTFELLQERGFEVVLVNPRQIKAVPGRKSDIQDCQWIQRLHSFGLLSPSFCPDAHICTLRTYLRQRSCLIEERAIQIQHMDKALALMNLQLGQVVSDITGVTGMAIMRAIVAGQTEPHHLARLRQNGCQHSQSDICRALTGHYRPEHVFVLRQALALYDAYTSQIADCDRECERYLRSLEPCTTDEPPQLPAGKSQSHSKNAPRYQARTLLYQLTGVDLVAIDGLSDSSVATILSEVGTDMSRFPTAKHFCSWLGLAPHHAISGGKALSRHTLKTTNRAGQAFRLAAQTLARSRTSGFAAFYRQLRARLGPQRAIVATAHKIARTFYHMLKYRTPFRDADAAQYDQHQRRRQTHASPSRPLPAALPSNPPPTQGVHEQPVEGSPSQARRSACDGDPSAGCS